MITSKVFATQLLHEWPLNYQSSTMLTVPMEFTSVACVAACISLVRAIRAPVKRTITIALGNGIAPKQAFPKLNFAIWCSVFMGLYGKTSFPVQIGTSIDMALSRYCVFGWIKGLLSCVHYTKVFFRLLKVNSTSATDCATPLLALFCHFRKDKVQNASSL